VLSDTARAADQLVSGLEPEAPSNAVTGAMKEFGALVATSRAEDIIIGLFGLTTWFEWFSPDLGSVLGLRFCAADWSSAARR